jgi:hypothetical protein
MGSKDLLSITWVGNAARRLMRSYTLTSGRYGFDGTVETFSNFSPGSTFYLTRNDGSYGDASDYEALQVGYNRRPARGLQLTANYTWSHAIDTNSDNWSAQSGTWVGGTADKTRGNSSADRRHIFNLATTYNMPSLHSSNALLKTVNKVLLRGWAINALLKVQSGSPGSVLWTRFMDSLTDGQFTSYNFRADLVPGQPLWLNDPTVPGGRKLNPDAFAIPACALLNANQVCNGSLPRNSIVFPGIWSLDGNISRTFNITEKLKFQVRADVYNVPNHPVFGAADTMLPYTVQGDPGVLKPSSLSSTFGQPTWLQVPNRGMQIVMRLNF